VKYCSLVRFDFDGMPVEYHSAYPFSKKDVFVYLGDIVQMPGHCVIARVSDGRVFTGHETDNFVELTSEEV